MVVNKKVRKYRRFSLKNALIGFPGEEKHWGEIVNSRGGFKALTKTINNHGLGG
ncbi:MAG: hypothetical protein QF907_01650 [Nitrospinota bacterium]|nr:hypothetical protein [Nitrospinota bacterium]MDP7579998.1 hypothetical protein [Nitrospinota bacterium]